MPIPTTVVESMGQMTGHATLFQFRATTMTSQMQVTGTCSTVARSIPEGVPGPEGKSGALIALSL